VTVFTAALVHFSALSAAAFTAAKVDNRVAVFTAVLVYLGRSCGGIYRRNSAKLAWRYLPPL